MFTERIKLLPDLSELITFHNEVNTASGARELTVFIKPSDCFLELMAALGACKGDLHTIDGGLHKPSLDRRSRPREIAAILRGNTY